MLRPGVEYSFHAIPYSMPDIKKLDKQIITLTKAICKVPRSTPNLAIQLPHKLFGMDAFSIKTAYLKYISEQLRDVLNDQGRLGIIYRGLTKYIMAKYGGSTILTHITTVTCLHSPTTCTIALLNENVIQIHSFDKNFHTTCTKLEKQWEERQHKLTILQQKNTQKLLHKLYTFNIYSLKDITMPNVNTLMTPDNFKKQYNSCSKCIKTVLYHCQLMFCQKNDIDTNHSTNTSNTQELNKLLTQYCIQFPIIQNPNQNQTPQTTREKIFPTPKQIYTKLHIHPIHQILEIKKTTCKDNYMAYKGENKYLCKWIRPNNTYIKWLPENKIFPYKKPNITKHNLVILEQHYKYQQNTHYSNSIFKHFHQRQYKDMRHMHPPIDTTSIHLDVTKCNPDKDIIATTPTIQTQDTSSHLFDKTRSHVCRIPTQRL